MSPSFRAGLFPVLIALIAACDDGPTRPEGPVDVTVMTRNVYVGANLESLLELESLSDLPDAVAAVWADVLATNFPERAGALAAEIEAVGAHLIGLQEVTLVRMQTPGDFFQGNPRSATDTAMDYLALLLDSLAARGQSYRPVAEMRALDVEVPIRLGAGLSDIRVTDREVILARAGVGASDPVGAIFSTNALAVVGDFGLPVLRAWTSVEATIEGVRFRFVSTHLETVELGPDEQVLQADELHTRFAASAAPVIMVGDFNSSADGRDTPTYGNLVAGGWVDAWARVRPNAPGPTCCHQADLRNAQPTLAKRIDIVFARGDLAVRAAGRTGVESGGRTPSGLWASDHAGVFARLTLR